MPDNSLSLRAWLAVPFFWTAGQARSIYFTPMNTHYAFFRFSPPAPAPARSPLRAGGLLRAVFLLLSVMAAAPFSLAAEAPESGEAVTAGQESAPAAKEVPPPFRFDDVMQKAERLAAKPYQDESSRVPDFLLALDSGDWHGIRFRSERVLWRGESPFTVAMYHPGFLYNRLVAVNVVEHGNSAPLVFTPDMFQYADPSLVERVRGRSLNFSGFRVHYPVNLPDVDDEVAVFLGATYFRAVAKNTGYGLAARALAVNTATPQGEEFPYFREFWLVKPGPDDLAMTVYALMDSPGMTAAYRFDIRPGTSTVMDVNCKIYPRGGSLSGKLGLAPLTSMYLFSETENGARGDYRPEVHNSDGLLVAAGGNNWTWRPLANPSRLAVNSFFLPSPKGFGLLQRDDIFDHYQDIDGRFERRPSLWVEPVSDWGPGRLELIEIPSKEEIHDNIIAFWVPGSEQNGEARRVGPLSFAYKLYWMAPNVTPHNLGRATATRLARRPELGVGRFIIDFEGNALNAMPAATGLSSLVETPEQCPLLDKKLVKNTVTGGWRLMFTVALPKQEGVMQSLLSAREARPNLRFKAVLMRGENLPDPLTEQWVYDLPQ